MNEGGVQHLPWQGSRLFISLGKQDLGKKPLTQFQLQKGSLFSLFLRFKIVT